jgi:hypothetical protein
MKNEKIRQKRLEKQRMKRKHHNKVADHRSRCEFGNYRKYQQEKIYEYKYRELEKIFK